MSIHYQGLVRIAYDVKEDQQDDQRDDITDLIAGVLEEYFTDGFERDRIYIDPDKGYIEIAINDTFYGTSAPFDIIDEIRTLMGPDFFGSVFIETGETTGHIEFYCGELDDQVVSKDAMSKLVAHYVDTLISDLTAKKNLFNRPPTPQENKEMPF